MIARALILAIAVALVALPVVASQLLSGGFAAPTQPAATAPRSAVLGTLLQDPFLIDSLNYAPPRRLAEIAD